MSRLLSSSPERGGGPRVAWWRGGGAAAVFAATPPPASLVPLPVPGRIFALALALALCLTTPAHADSLLPPAEYADTQLADPRQEAAATALMETLRCLVCQGQSIADSDADMAGDMRALVRRRIEAGEEPREIRDWLIDRYGNWVSYAPPVEPVTWPLWAAPLLLLAAGLWLARGRFRRRSRR